MNLAFRSKLIVLIISSLVFFTGCACLKEAGKKAWGSSTQALEKARDKAKSESFACSLEDCFDACLAVLKEKEAVVFQMDRKAAYIVAMNFETAIDTTQVGIFFVKADRDTTKVEITSLNPRLLETISPYIFSNIAKQIKLKHSNQTKKE